MTSAYFNPFPAVQRPCWHCTHYVGLTAGGSAARCRLPNGPRVQSMPASGCSAWQREPGADDEPDAPPEHAQPAGVGARAWKPKETPAVNVPVRWAP